MSRFLPTVLFCVAAPALAQAGPTFTTERIVGAGRTQKIAYFAAVDPACHSMGPVSVNLLDTPHVGQVEVAQGREYPNFSTFNPRARCTTQKLPATQILYTAPPGYAGEDDFTIEIVGPLGGVQRWRYRLTIR
ncbi:hypothetical protein [Methylobacterium oryzisoli]|uniref:hypothetical protein n=1 Tax=Methylobacterium oryzisoli TaxID=3385502 RepID=UPI00389172A4